MATNMLTRKLTIEEQQDLVNTLFGFNFVNEGDEKTPHYVLYDDDGLEFYGSNENCQYDFSTLAGIFSFTAHLAIIKGYSDCQYTIKKALGIH